MNAQLAIPGLKFWTPRTPGAPTIGDRQGRFAAVWLRQPFMPWQQLAADLIGEYNPDTGLPLRTLWVITGPRQIGKSHLDMAQTGERCFTIPNFRAWYTAQTGGDARDQFLKFADENVADTPLSRVVRTLRGNGHEVMKFPNGSTLRPHPPTESAMHGKQSDRSGIDEGWAFDELEGKQLLQAIAPTQLTRPGAQVIIWSAGGTAASTWLAALVARGRAGDPAIGYLELGIPDDMALDDLEGIAQHHPAYGHTVTMESIKALRSQLTDDAEFARAAGNRWTEIIGGAIPGEQYADALTSVEIPEGVPVAYGAARAADGSEVAVAVAAIVDGVPVAEVLDVFPSFGAADRVASWVGREAVAVDPSGPAAALAADLTRLRAKLMAPTTREVSAACANVSDALAARQLRLRPHPSMDAAVRVVAKRGVGDGGFVWSRVSAAASIASWEAITLALHALRNAPAPTPAIQMRFGAA